MSGQHSRSPDGASPKDELIQPIVRLVLALVILGVIQLALPILPGVDTVILQPDITAATVLYALVTLVMFGAILNFAMEVGSILSRAFPNVPAVQRVINLAALLVIAIWAYQVFWWLPYFRTNQAQYDYLFLIVGLGLGGWLGYLVYTNVDEFAELATDVIRDSDFTEAEPPTDAGSDPDAGGGDERPRNADQGSDSTERRTSNDE